MARTKPTGNFERMARGWIGDNSTIAAVFRLAANLAGRIGKPLESPSIRAEFDGCIASLGAKADRTRERYAQIARQFLTHLGAKSEDRILTLIAQHVESYRDARLECGISPRRGI
jgi:hypothetical protein